MREREELWRRDWNAVSCEVVLQLSDACGGFCFCESVNYPEVGKTVHNDEIVFPISGADIYCTHRLFLEIHLYQYGNCVAVSWFGNEGLLE